MSKQPDKGLQRNMAIFLWTFIFALVFGAFSIHAEIFPGTLLKQAFTGGEAYIEKAVTNYRSEFHVNLWWAERTREKGVVVHDPERAYNGYTFVTNGRFTGAWLLDMKGDKVHEWSLPFRSAFPDSPHVPDPVKEELIYWRRAWLYPNGDVLAIYVANGDTPYGYGLIKVDKDSKLLWSVPERTHHDIWVDEEGTIYALGHEILDELPPGLNFIKTPYIDDYILIISPDGKVLDRIRILEALYNSDYRNELFKVALGYQYGGDFLHINTVRTIPARLEGKLPFLKKGLITTSSKHMSFVGLVDPKERKMVWLDRGVGLFQHDPEFTDDGTVMIFDNYGEYAKTSRSRVVEYDPVDRTIVWQWNGDGKTALYSDMRSTKQILPNGNILVTESDGGRLLEVTRDKKVVWEYVNPERMTLDGVTKIAVLSGAKRYLPEDLTFLGGTSKAR